jgi:hypothetical protein
VSISGIVYLDKALLMARNVRLNTQWAKNREARDEQILILIQEMVKRTIAFSH